MAISLVAMAGCSPVGGGDRTVVGSFYPLAFVADRVAGPDWEVIDLTPPGTETHDVELSLEDRTAIQAADVVLYLGDIGFQPQVEEAVGEARGRVLPLADFVAADSAADPHLWLDPRHMGRIAEVVASAIPGASSHALQQDLAELYDRYRSDLADCRSRVMVVSHEAFGYLADAFGLEQIGLTGLSPEAEPTVERLGVAGEALEDGRATAVFYEAGDEARRIAESVAADFGVPALPLGTLESEPASGDYLSVMEDNLDSLRQGLGCR
ncbi:MAG: metal ABC transporter substrate-binding protein [Actinomycetota bacterium]